MTEIPELNDGEAWRDLIIKARKIDLSNEPLSDLVSQIVAIERNLCVIKLKREAGYNLPDDAVFENSCKTYVQKLYAEIQRRDYDDAPPEI